MERVVPNALLELTGGRLIPRTPFFHPWPRSSATPFLTGAGSASSPSVTLERLNAFVGLLVGIATLVYLCLRIRDQLRNRNSKPSSED